MNGSATPAVMCISQEEGGEAWPPSKRPEKEKPEREREDEGEQREELHLLRTSVV